MRKYIATVTFIVFLAPSLASAAIAYDTSANRLLNASPDTFAYTNSGNFIVVKPACNGGYATSVTYNGVALTKVAGSDANPDYFVNFWYTTGTPATGSNNIVVTGSGSCATQVSSYTGANGGFEAASATQTGSGTSVTTTTTVSGSDCWVVTSTEFGGNPTGGGTNNTQRQSSGNHFLGDSNGVVGPGSVNATTAGNSSPYSSTTISFCATGAAATVFSFGIYSMQIW